MKKDRLLYLRFHLFITCTVLLSACGPATLVVSPESEIDLSGAVETAGPEAAVLDAVRELLIRRFGANEELVEIQSFEPAEWPDTCLGIQSPGEVCIERATQGFGGKAEVNEIPIEFRTNENGLDIRFIPQAALAAQDVLIEQLGTLEDEIRFVSIDHMEWPDTCLGISSEGEMCAKVVTPGYKVVMLVGGQQYEFRTDIEGSTVLQALAP